jgi:tail tube GTA-gp10-like protein
VDCSLTMSRDASVILTFLDGEEYVFRLAWGQLIKLQEARNCGPFLVLERLHGEDWRMEDIRDVIRFGLVGGGMDEIKARKLVKEYVEQRPPLDALPLAKAVIIAGVAGPPDEEPIEKKAQAATEPTISPMAGSGSPLSSASPH